MTAFQVTFYFRTMITFQVTQNISPKRLIYVKALIFHDDFYNFDFYDESSNEIEIDFF